MSILQGINSPADIKKLSDADLTELSGEIREFLIQTVSKTGGHIASSLGAVELTLAVHRVFDSPHDKIFFDVGHQCYTHKIITGRRDRMDTLRTFGGISGFPKPYESEHDAFVAGHASTSISLALGYALAEKLRGSDNCGIAVIGDGALTGGMAYEALSNAGRSDANIVVVLNDNGMAISRNVGSVARGLTRIRTSHRYFKAKDRTHRFLRAIPFIGRGLDRIISSLVRRIKSFIYDTTFFEDLNLVYLGPVNGHDIGALTVLLNRAKALHKPCVVHAVTVKGKGFSAAEHDPVSFHGAPKFDAVTGAYAPAGVSYSTVAGQTLSELAIEDERLCVITAAMTDGCGLCNFARAFPNRFFDVGIAEEHAVTFGAGLAAGGMLPVFAVYSTFLQRCADQLIHDVSLSGIKMVFAVDRAGIVGADGETHQGLYDIPLLRDAGITVLCPSNFAELKVALHKALYDIPGAVAVRYPRGGEPAELSEWMTMDSDYAVLRDEKSRLAIVTHGALAAQVLEAAGELSDIAPAVVKLNCLSPLSSGLSSFLSGFDRVVYAAEEESACCVGEAIAASLSGTRTKVSIHLPHGFVEQGTPAQLREKLGLDGQGIAEFCRKVCADER